MVFNCGYCNYETCDKSNFNKHLKSASHVTKCKTTNSIGSIEIPLDSTSTNRIRQNSKKSIKCEYCEEIFSHKSSYYRHKKNFCQLIKKSDEVKKENEQLKKLLMDKDNQMKDLEIKYLKKEIDELKLYIQSAKPSCTTFNISVKNYVQQNYADAPPLKQISDFSTINLDYDEKLMENLAYCKKNKKLDKYLGDFLIGYYKKEDPSKQSIWNSDVSRLTYVIKELLTNNRSCWNHDFKGVKTKNYIIQPLLSYLKQNIDSFIYDLRNRIKNKKIEEITLLLETAHNVTLVKEDIESGLLSDNIVKYLAPHFSLEKEKTLEI